MKVAVAVVTDTVGRLLITRRPQNASHGGQWEFPGGKLEDYETPEAALKRELMEEVGLGVQEAHFLAEISHSYERHDVILYVYRVTRFDGNPTCQESQTDLRWVARQDLDGFEFPAANASIISLLNQS